MQNMGNCFSCLLSCCGKRDDGSQFGENSDRAQLIDPNGANTAVQRIQSENYYSSYTDPIFQRKTEEQSDLSKILQEMATNVIDVGTLGSHSLEQHESRERSNFYINKMRSLVLSRSLTKLPKQSLLLDVPSPERIFTSSCNLPNDELNSIRYILGQVDHLVDDMKIGSYDDLIIPFQVQV